MARTPIASDNFNRSTGLGSNWTQLGGSTIIIDSDIRYCAQHFNLTAAARWDGAGTFSNDQYSSSLIQALGGNEGSIVGTGVLARASADADPNHDFYAAAPFMTGSGNKQVLLEKFVNGARTTLATSSAVSWTAGTDFVDIECVGDQISSLKNAVALDTVTDTSLTTGKPGIYSGGSAAAGYFNDDWVGGDVGGGGGGGRISKLAGSGGGLVGPNKGLAA